VTVKLLLLDKIHQFYNENYCDSEAFDVVASVSLFMFQASIMMGEASEVESSGIAG
jgi:hypothetical protein